MSSTVKIIVISMPGAVLRRDMIEKNLGNLTNIKWKFFDGLTEDSAVSGLLCDKRKQQNAYGRHLTPGEIGCFKSHYAVMKQIAEETDDGWTIVLEDDVFYDVNFEITDVIVFAKKNNINYIRLFSRMYKPADFVATLNGARQIIRFRTDPYGTQGYLINKQGALRFLQEVHSINLPIDDELGRFWRHGLDAYSVFPFPIVERSMPSSLEQSRVEHGINRKRYIPRLIMSRISDKILKTFYNKKFILAR